MSWNRPLLLLAQNCNSAKPSRIAIYSPQTDDFSLMASHKQVKTTQSDETHHSGPIAVRKQVFLPMQLALAGLSSSTPASIMWHQQRTTGTTLIQWVHSLSFVVSHQSMHIVLETTRLSNIAAELRAILPLCQMVYPTPPPVLNNC